MATPPRPRSHLQRPPPPPHGPAPLEALSALDQIRQPAASGSGPRRSGRRPRRGAHRAAAERPPRGPLPLRAARGRSGRERARRPPQRLPPRPGTSGLTAGAPGNKRRKRRAVTCVRRIALSAGSDPRPSLPGPSSSWRPPPSPAPGDPPAPRSAPCAASGRLRKMAALPGKTKAGPRWRGRPGRAGARPRPLRAAPDTAPLRPPRRWWARPASPLPPRAPPQAPPSAHVQCARPRRSPASRPARDGGGGGAGRRGGAAAVLPDAALHGGAGAAARVPPALVPPH